MLNGLLAMPARSRARVEACARADARAGVGVRVIAEDGPTERLIDRALAGKTKPTGWFVPMPDDQLTEAYRALQAHGIRPGKDVGFIGCSYDAGRLTTLDAGLPNIDICPEAIARAATEMMLWRLANPDEPRRRLMVEPALVLSVGEKAKRS